MYKTSKWKKKREKILKRDKYLCKECLRYGRTTQAQMVHHIYTYERHKELAFNDNNLISLCNNCHNKMHIRDSHELTKLGQEMQLRFKNKIFHTPQGAKVNL